ncbi:MAG: hypothetical protein AMXMBFR7_40330 [Planctomycetota bacterium]
MAMLRSRQAAERKFHDHIGPEHIYVGLLEDPENGACEVLEAQGVEHATALAEAEGLLVRGEKRDLPGQLPFTEQAKRVLQLSYEEARALNSTYVGTEHLILGVLHVHKAGELKQAGCLEAVTLERARPLVLERMGRLSESPYVFDADFRPASYLRFCLRLRWANLFMYLTYEERILFALGLPQIPRTTNFYNAALKQAFAAAVKVMRIADWVQFLGLLLIAAAYGWTLRQNTPLSEILSSNKSLTAGLLATGLGLVGASLLFLRDLHVKALALWAARDGVPPT